MAIAVLKVCLVLGAVYLLMLAALYVFQEKLIFFPTRDLHHTPADFGWPYEDVTVQVGEDTTHGWSIAAAGEARGVLLFSHGNAANIADRLDSIGVFRSQGLDVLIYDYGGYGRSTGKPSEDRCYADARAMYDYLVQERRVSRETIVFFGRSLGAAVACDLAATVTTGAIIMESPFLSADRLGQDLYPVFPVRLLSRVKFDNAGKIADVEAPVLVIHSREDEIIPFRHGERLYELANEPKDLLVIRGGHNDGFWVSGNMYAEGIARFLEEHLPS